MATAASRCRAKSEQTQAQTRTQGVGLKSASGNSSMNKWYLEGFLDNKNILARVSIAHYPFQIGRHESLDFNISTDGVSRLHAELLLDENDQLMVRDFGSTNGTLVNHERVLGQSTLRHGDVLHFGAFECRVMCETRADPDDEMLAPETLAGIEPLQTRLPTGVSKLEDLLERQATTAAYQGIYEFGTGKLVGIEILGRGEHPGLPESPGELFQIAESVGLEIPLSELFRNRGVANAAAMSVAQPLFMNTHPGEFKEADRLLQSLRELRAAHPNLQLVLEIHEHAISDIDQFAKVKKALEALEIELAYDDFGAGQARLLELVEASPEYLKFDISLIKDIDQAPQPKLQLVEALLGMAHNMNIVTLAEGVSNENEATRCKQLGFELVQGYFFHQPIMDLAKLTN